MEKTTLRKVQSRLQALASPSKAGLLQRFFKTGPGEYAQGDIFLGIAVPDIRSLARESDGLTLRCTQALLRSRFHEARLLALLLLIERFENSDVAGKRAVYQAYTTHMRFVNNWDLVDLSAPHIVGAYLADKHLLRSQVLERLARSSDLWERRIAIVATFHYIRNNRFDDTLSLAQLLLADPHDLIHKSTGWMLREIGKRDRSRLEGFLRSRYRAMPRTMLRYAIERFPEQKRKAYLRGSV